MITTSKKVYSARELLQYIPQIACEPSMRKFLEADMKGANMFGTIVQRIGKHKRFFVPENNLEKIISTFKYDNSNL